MKTTDFTPGLLVYYKPGKEYGYVSSTNEHVVFVKYFGGNIITQQGIATAPDDLEIVKDINERTQTVTTN